MCAPPVLRLQLLLRLNDSWGECEVDRIAVWVSLVQEVLKDSEMARTPEWMAYLSQEHE